MVLQKALQPCPLIQQKFQTFGRSFGIYKCLALKAQAQFAELIEDWQAADGRYLHKSFIKTEVSFFLEVLDYPGLIGCIASDYDRLPNGLTQRLFTFC
jgi:hypothetical protein